MNNKKLNNHGVHGVSWRKNNFLFINSPCSSVSSVVYFFSLFSFLFFLFLLLFSCKSSKIETDAVIETVETAPRYELTFIAAGDNLIHDTIINSHRLEDGSYNFDPIYSEIKDIVQAADLAFINQETMMGGVQFGYQGWPTFNTPESMAYTLRDAGFNIINIANNHTMDIGRQGLYNTIDLLESIKEFTVIGARKEGVHFRLLRKNNITLGFLSYTYGLNGMPLPRDNPNAVSLINREVMARELNYVRKLCDFLIVSMHWGDEYVLVEPVPFQKNLAVFLAQHNVDLIIGHHPHVLQRVEMLPRPDGKETLCFYSLGNFVSNQNEIDRIFGGMMAVTIVKEEDDAQSAVFISDYGLIPTVTHYEDGFTNTKVYPYYAYTEELKNIHLLHIRHTMSFDYFKSILDRLDTKIIMKNPY